MDVLGSKNIEGTDFHEGITINE